MLAVTEGAFLLVTSHQMAQNRGFNGDFRAWELLARAESRRDAILADDSQVVRYMPLEQTYCRVARTNRHHVIAAHQRVNFRPTQEKRSLLKPRIV